MKTIKHAYGNRAKDKRGTYTAHSDISEGAERLALQPSREVHNPSRTIAPNPKRADPNQVGYLYDQTE